MNERSSTVLDRQTSITNGCCIVASRKDWSTTMHRRGVADRVRGLRLLVRRAYRGPGDGPSNKVRAPRSRDRQSPAPARLILLLAVTAGVGAHTRHATPRNKTPRSQRSKHE